MELSGNSRKRYCLDKRKYFTPDAAYKEIRRIRKVKGKAAAEGIYPYACPDNDRLSEFEQHWHIGHSAGLDNSAPVLKEQPLITPNSRFRKR